MESCEWCTEKETCPLYSCGVRFLDGEMINRGDPHALLKLAESEEDPIKRAEKISVIRGEIFRQELMKRFEKERDKGKTTMKIQWDDED